MNLSRCLAVMMLAGIVSSVSAAEKPVRTMLHGGWNAEPPAEEYLRFVEQVKPDILIIGVFDQQLYATVSPTGKAKAKDPAELLARWKEVIARLNKQGIRVIGQMELNVVSDRQADLTESTGWFAYYDKHWDEKLLGKKPARTAADLLEEPDLDPMPPKKENALTTALCGCRVNPKSLNACINKQSWREVQKRMVRAAINLGVDGFMTNRNYFGHCACEDCRKGFRRWLSDYSKEELKTRFGIDDLAKHPPDCVIGMHRDPTTAPPELVIEKQRFIKHKIKEFFDEVYIEHGRKLKPDLFVSQWNHMANFDELHLDKGHLPPSTRTSFAHGAADERWGLSPKLWGRDESLIWYCNWGTTQNTILEKEYAGDTVLYGKLVRALADGKPYVVNKYDFYRPRNMMAEAAAMGYATNAVGTPIQAEEDREVVATYFAFLKKHEAFLQPSESYAEVGLVFPRRAVHAGDGSPLEYVEAAGRALINRHVLFDMLPDDLLATLKLDKYRAIVISAPEYLEKAEREAIARYAKSGGKVLLLPVAAEDRTRPGAASERTQRWPDREKLLGFDATIVKNARTNRAIFIKELDRAVGGAERLSGLEAPWTVELHAYRQPASKRIVVHLVNYNHDEKAKGKSVAERESPIATEPAKLRLHLPDQFKVKSIRYYSPEVEAEALPKFQQKARVLEVQTPGFQVYGLCVVEGE